MDCQLNLRWSASHLLLRIYLQRTLSSSSAISSIQKGSVIAVISSPRLVGHRQRTFFSIFSGIAQLLKLGNLGDLKDPKHKLTIRDDQHF